MMAGNPKWWSMHPQQPSQLSINNPQKFAYGGSNITSSASADSHSLNQDFPPVGSWSQLLLGEDRYGDGSSHQQQKNWEEQVSIFDPYSTSLTRQEVPVHVDVKQEHLVVQPTTCHVYDARDNDGIIIHQRNNIHASKPGFDYNWPAQNNPTASSNGFLNFVEGDKNQNQNKHQHQHNQDQSSECNSTSNRGGVSKKARVQQSSSQPALKVRKEKLGDRVTALHQLVSPFGKTDTASVLSEAICCIRFLQNQIEALSTPYMRNASATASTGHHQSSELQSQGDLRSRGLCLVPISCTQNVGNDTTATDYWAPNYHL